jgi:hypothetical protein
LGSLASTFFFFFFPLLYSFTMCFSSSFEGEEWPFSTNFLDLYSSAFFFLSNAFRVLWWIFFVFAG